jgi:hypothetical protein
MTLAPRAAPRGPGLAKTRGDRLFLRRAVELRASVPGAMAAFVRAADVVSEGDVREEGGRRVYYGSTSLLLVEGARVEVPGSIGLCALLASDPHVRLLALRVAVREAAHRAGAGAGPASAEIAFREVRGGVLATVDVTVPLDNLAERTA